MQTAYDILSDPQERAWYDSHRDAILQNQEVDDFSQDPSHFRNVRVTSAEDISSLVGRFNAAVPFTDEPTGFFGSLRDIFDQLAAEETALGDHGDRDPISYPAFGTSTSDYDDVVRPFYSGWAGFSTRKTFSWKDKYRLPDAPDRRVRRLMEKENRKCRDDAIREFNDAVRFLVGFSRKRDPRYLPNTQTDSDRQKALRSTVAAQAARSRAANQEKHLKSIVADWVEAGRDDEPVGDTSESEEEPHMEQVECVVCRKVFKSENQYQAHERSKKHVKAVEKLRREMRRENKDLDLESSANQSVSIAPQESVSPVEPFVSMEPPDTPLREVDSDSTQAIDPAVETSDSAPKQANPPPESQDGCAKPEMPASLGEPSPTLAQDSGADSDSNASNAISSLTLEEKARSSKVGKAKARRAKKAARQTAAPGTAMNSVGPPILNDLPGESQH